ncbi:serine hydrolase domain-containing protein, partial [Xanthovirga aplysinae]|uniref:serine hydrolase domain-containing protein n=1 Tax=Xanthovirga aplysinae TaxID=2529853 RepID=UPI0012BC36DD
WANKIKLIDLITHTSGLPAYDNTKSLQEFEGFNEENPFGLFKEDFILSLLKGVDSIPDYGKIKYSNYGIGVLAIAMENATGKSFDELFQQYIVNNLGLKNTFLQLKEIHFTNLAIPHRGAEVMPLIQLADLKSAGSIKASLPDIISFLQIHLQPSEKYKPIANNVFENQLKDTENRVGIGWGIFERNGVSLRGHNGGTFGSSSIVIVAPEKNIGLAVVANNQDNSKLAQYAFRILENLMN